MKTIFTTLFAVVALSAATNVYAQMLQLNSFPQAQATIFLNFNGEYVSGTSWNWYGPIDAQPAGLSAVDELEIFNRVAEDYRPFNINVTTDPAVYAAAPYNKRSHVIVTPTSGWYGSAGGVAYVGCFNWGDDTPAWVFSALLSNNVKNIAEACSHELGHTLGLQHQSVYNSDCVKTAEYYAGQGDGEIGWAPIMGVGYGKNLTTWHTGASTAGCSIIQNDMDIIAGPANGIGYRNDDYGDSIDQATDLPAAGESFAATGVINRMTDVDVFKILLDGITRLRLNAVPQNVGSGNQGADIDIRVSILNAAADTLGSYNPSTLLDAGIDTMLAAGAYYIAVRGTGNINHTSYGSLGAYALTGSLLRTLPVQQFVLTGNASGSYHKLSWWYRSDEPIQTIVVESSADGKAFMPLADVGDAATSYSYQPAGQSVYYRLKAVSRREGSVYYSNVICLLTAGHEKKIRLLSAVVSDQVRFTSNTVCGYQLFDAAGKLVGKGSVAQGTNTINIQQAPKGMLLLRFTDASMNRVEKLIKR